METQLARSKSDCKSSYNYCVINFSIVFCRSANTERLGMANASLLEGGALEASRKVPPVKLIRDAMNNYRLVNQTLSIDSDLEDDEDGLHINFSGVTKTLLETCAANAKEARRVSSGGSSSHNRRPSVFLENICSSRATDLSCWMRA